MKKFFNFAAVAAMLLTVGCAKELSYTDGDTDVVFNIEVPALADATRDIADGTTATQLYNAIYTEGRVLIPGLLPAAPIVLQNKETKLTFRLVKGQTYNFVFWAEPENDTYYDFNTTDATVTVNYASALANDEKRDAFYKMVPNFKVGTSVPEDVILKRPFAQVNLGANVDDVAAAQTAGIDIQKSKVTFTDVPNKLNMWDGTTEGSVAVEFDFETIPAKSGEKLEVKSTEYHYVAMNYILADENPDVTDVVFTLKDVNDVEINSTKVPAANYKRNYRTNILGYLFTSSSEWKIVIDENPDGEFNITEDTNGGFTNSEEVVFP